MADCIVIDAQGAVVFTGQPATECSGYVLVSAAEHGLYAFIEQALAVPDPEIIMGWFSGCVGTVLLFYMAAYYVSRITGMFNRD